MNLKRRLIIAIGIVLLLAWAVMAFWIWHETNEQLEILVDVKLSNAEKVQAVRYEIKEIFLALTLSLFAVLASVLVLVISITNRFLQPFINLAEQLKTKTDLDLSAVDIELSSKEAEIIAHRLNQLLEIIGQRIEYEKQFTADVAHELRTPLAGMRLNLELMDDVPEKNLLLNRIDELLITIERLLQFARANHELHFEHVAAFNFHEEVIQPLMVEYEDNYPCPIHWVVTHDWMMKGDPSLLYLLLKNLLDNAAFYAPNSDCVIVSAEHCGNEVMLRVVDNGHGIAEHQMMTIKQRYRRADVSRQGFGLGLNIVERIAHAHNGTMTIQNRMDGQTGLMVEIHLRQ